MAERGANVVDFGGAHEPGAGWAIGGASSIEERPRSRQKKWNV
jgi:hypothetical protein